MRGRSRLHFRTRSLGLKPQARRVSRGELYEYIRGIVHRKSFYWQRGYGAFSVSELIRPVVERYIQNQEKHHARHGYQSEFRQLLKRHGLPHEEEHLWD